MMIFRWILAALLLVVTGASIAAEPRATEGVVAQIQLVDVSALADETFLILSLDDERHFLLPETTQLPAAPGVLVAIDYLPAAGEGDLPEACRIKVLGLPITIDGEEVLQRASRPFEVYRNPRAECGRLAD